MTEDEYLHYLTKLAELLTSEIHDAKMALYLKKNYVLQFHFKDQCALRSQSSNMESIESCDKSRHRVRTSIQ